MFIQRPLEQKLAEFEKAIDQGRAQWALERLNLLLAEFDVTQKKNLFNVVSILRVMSVAAFALGSEDCGVRFLSRAIELLRTVDSQAVVGNVTAMLDLAEMLAVRKQMREAMCFAEGALESVAANSTEFWNEELITVLTRYAEIARLAGFSNLARDAYTYALLIVYSSAGVETEVGPALLSLTQATWDVTKTGAIKNVGQILLDTLSQAA